MDGKMAEKEEPQTGDNTRQLNQNTTQTSDQTQRDNKNNVSKETTLKVGGVKRKDSRP